MLEKEEASPLPPFAVVIPMYNEEAGARECVRAVCTELDRLSSRSILICVNDGSHDRTGSILAEMERTTARLKVISHVQNRGYGAALQTGSRHAYESGFTYVLFMDSDLTNHPSDIPRFAAEMARGFDVIKATRYSKGGTVDGVPAYRVWISRLGNRIAGVLFSLPFADATNGFRAVRTDLLVRMQLRENRFPVIMEELYWCRFVARTFSELPVTLTNRTASQRPTSFIYSPRVLWDYLKYPLRAKLGINPWQKETR